MLVSGFIVLDRYQSGRGGDHRAKLQKFGKNECVFTLNMAVFGIKDKIWLKLDRNSVFDAILLRFLAFYEFKKVPNFSEFVFDNLEENRKYIQGIGQCGQKVPQIYHKSEFWVPVDPSKIPSPYLLRRILSLLISL